MKLSRFLRRSLCVVPGQGHDLDAQPPERLDVHGPDEAGTDNSYLPG
jgi:hypothetical protein